VVWNSPAPTCAFPGLAREDPRSTLSEPEVAFSAYTTGAELFVDGGLIDL